jgi:hypothetical protein
MSTIVSLIRCLINLARRQMDLGIEFPDPVGLLRRDLARSYGYDRASIVYDRRS